MKKLLLCIALFNTILINAQTKMLKEEYRPKFHFSPVKNWCNDPNGLVYNNGTYNLFYQSNPFGNKWGHMSWSHATSKDLVHWTDQPIAIPEENGIMIFSGTCVVDKKNTSGFGRNGQIPMVAVYTGNKDSTNQSQNIAYSLDNGITWTKYSNNPILDLHKKDFRDPKIFWYDKKGYWIMCLMLPVEHKVQFYSSKNLKEWEHLSDFGPVGDTSGVWECPDLTEVPVEGVPGKKKWLLQTSQNSSMQYFVGEFDGIKFTNENPENKIFRPDYGPDYYAAITFNQLPHSLLPIGIGWINNWKYANDIPTSPWKGCMSLPRNLSLKKINNEWILIQQPIAAIKLLRKKLFNFPDTEISGSQLLTVKSKQFEIELDILPNPQSICGIQIAKGKNNFFEIGYDAAKQLFYIDRTNSGNTNFNENFKNLGHFEKPISLKDDRLKLHIYFDHSIAEIFVNDGEAVFTAQIFPDEKDNGIELFNRGAKSEFKTMLWGY